MNEVRLTVHRATNQIGGNCIELADTAGHRILLDVGRPLDAPSAARGLLPKSLNVASSMDGILISHPHQDHYGLLEDVPPNWPIYSGTATERLIRLTSAIFGKELPHTFHRWKSRGALEIGPFKVTPFLIDHSAFDAYMLLIEVHGKRIFYSCDFRTHGRKAILTKRLKTAPPKNIDVLLWREPTSGAISRASPRRIWKTISRISFDRRREEFSLRGPLRMSIDP